MKQIPASTTTLAGVVIGKSKAEKAEERAYWDKLTREMFSFDVDPRAEDQLPLFFRPLPPIKNVTPE